MEKKILKYLLSKSQAKDKGKRRSNPLESLTENTILDNMVCFMFQKVEKQTAQRIIYYYIED